MKLWSGMGIVLASALCVMPCLAQTQPSAAQLELAERYINQTVDFEQQRSGLEMLAVFMGPSIPEDAAPEFEAAFRKARRDSLPALETHFKRALSEAAATTFTEEELAALVSFYDTSIGRSVARKTREFTQAPSMIGRSLGRRFDYEILSRVCSAAECPQDLKDTLEASRP